MANRVADLYGPYLDKSLVEQMRKASDIDALNDIVYPIFKNKWKLGVREHRRRMKRLVASIIHMEPDLGKLYRYDYLIQILHSLDQNSVLQMCSMVGITIPPKARKKGKQHIIERVVTKFHNNARIRENLSRIMDHNMYMAIPFLKDDSLNYPDFEKCVKEFLQNRDPNADVDRNLTGLYMLSMILGNTKYASYVVRMFKADTWRSFEQMTIQAFMVYEWATLNDSNQNSHHMNLEDMLKEQEKLRNEIKRREKQQASLKTELHQKSLKEKELKSKIHELNVQLQKQLEDAVAEIQRLEMQLEEQKKFYEDEMKKLTEQHTEETCRLKNEIRILRASAGNSTTEEYKPLKGTNVLVIGHPRRKSEYQNIVERYGGSFEFYSSSPDGSSVAGVEGPAVRADVIFYLATFTSHTMLEKLKSLVPIERVKFLYASGINYFESQLLEYAQSLPSDANAS